MTEVPWWLKPNITWGESIPKSRVKLGTMLVNLVDRIVRR